MKRIISYLLFSLCCIIAFGANAAERKITGVVIAGDYKEPLIGASVFVSSEILKKAGSSQTTLGVITDMDGKFTINVPDGVTTLQCSYVGYDHKPYIWLPEKAVMRLFCNRRRICSMRLL